MLKGSPIEHFVFYVSRDYFTLAYAVLPLKRVQIGQTLNVYNFVKRCDFLILRSSKVNWMIPEHVKDLFIEKSRVEMYVMLKMKVNGSSQSSELNIHAPS